MSLNRTFAIVLRQFYLVRGSPARVLPLFAWVGIDMVLWGFITRYLNAVSSAGFDFVPVLLGAVLLWDFFTTPLAISDYVAGLVVSSIGTSSVGLIVMLFLASAIFGLSFVSYGVAIIPFLLVLFLFGVALGIVGAAIVLRFGPATEWFIWPIPALVSPFAGVFYPLATLPTWMQYFSRIVPPSYVFENVRAIISGHPPSVNALIWSVVLAVIYVLLACWVFTGVYRHSVRTGLVARYSAETVS